MADPEGTLTAVLNVDSDWDDDEMNELTQRLRAELLELDVERVEPATAGNLPEGAKGLELLSIGSLVVKFVLQAPLLKAIVDTSVAWLGRQQARSIKLTIDGDSLEVTGVSTAEQTRLVELWISRHASEA